MKRIVFIFLGCFIWMSLTGACTIGSISESNLLIKAKYRSQAATSFSVRCDRSYNIKFSSRNLRNSTGQSFVSNGQYRLRTQMSILGAKKNLWNTPISGDVSSLGHKYTIVVQLDEQPNQSFPAGMYTDQINVGLSF